jgi:DNA-binding response OmpR family regulator
MAAPDSGRAPRPRFAAILIVEPEPLLREILVSGLRLHDPRFAPHAVPDPEAALAWLSCGDVDLVITEAAFGEGGGTRKAAYLKRLRASVPHAPLLVLTRSAAEVPRWGAPFDAVVGKPPDMEELLGRVDHLLERSRESAIRGMAVESLLQVLQIERADCTLAVSARGRIGRLFLRAGELHHAEVNELRGREAFFELLRWPSPILSLGEAHEAETTITTALAGLLLQFYVNEDQRRR